VSGSISAPAGFFLNDAVTPDTATDLLSAVAAASANVNNALISEQNAAASATAAAASATAAAGSSNSAANNVATAATSATNAAGSATSAASSASAASTSANNASTSANSASTAATNAATSASNAAGSATAASNSASAANTSATNASASQAAAANSATAAAASNSAALAPNTGRNKLHNSMFNIAQRGNGPWTTGAYTVDRWFIGAALDTMSWSRVTLSDSDRTQIGDEEAVNALQNTFTGNSGATAYNNMCQRIEGVHRFSNKTLIISFWAKAASGSPLVGVSLSQYFGTGGSPSAPVGINGSAVTLSTTWARYQVIITVPRTAGTTLGTSGGDYTQVVLWFSSGSTNSAFSGGLGVQSGTVTLWGIQAEVGSTETPLEKPDPYYELATCQRFFNALPSAQFSLYAVGAGLAPAALLTFPPMRAAPTIAQSGATFSNATALSFSGIKPGSSQTSLTASGAGTATCTVSLTLSADL
jgi:hypothetical protein